MMKTFSRLTRFCLPVFCCLGSFAADAPARDLKTARGKLSFADGGFHLRPSAMSCPTISPEGEPLWAVILQPAGHAPVKGAAIALTNAGLKPTIDTEGAGVRLVWDRLTDGSRTWDIRVTIDARVVGDAYQIAADIKNDANGWLVSGFVGPVLNGIRADLSQHPLLTPEGFGRRTNRNPEGAKPPAPWTVAGDHLELSARYPGARGTMQWCAFAGATGGLYLGCHDPAHGAKDLSARFDPDTRAFAFAVKHHTFCPAGEKRVLPPLVILPYEGSWHTAAAYYRAWFDDTFSLREPPAWAQDASGWLLCILKQQNGEIMWDYPSLAQLCDIADKRGLDILGLFGWAHGGHDHLYPDYLPDEKMGGERALRQALKEIRRRGKRSILYANGQLQERDTEFWNARGKDIAVIQRDGISVQQTYHKFSNIPKYRFDLGCLRSDAWYERMLSLAVQAHDLGADGILFDQLGMSGPMECYGVGHGHAVPEMVYAAERPAFIRKIADHMKAIDPGFIVMTEGLHDSVLDSIAMFHGCVLGMFYASAQEMASRLGGSRPSDPFPEMFRYTFPEVMSTVRVPTPMMDRGMANYTCAYGLRYEIESRYGPDVAYLKDHRVPEKEDYRHVINLPDLAMMRATPPGDAATYLAKIVAFQKTHAALLWRARFTDTTAFAFRGDGLIAKGFETPDRIATMIWNPGDTPARFEINVRDASLVCAAEPENGAAEAFSELAPQTVRLIVWKRNGAIQP